MPRYSRSNDYVECIVHPMYGARKWKLPMQWVEYPIKKNDSGTIFKRTSWFVRLLLEGEVFSEFNFRETYRHLLAIPPAYAVRKPHDPRVAGLVHALQDRCAKEQEHNRCCDSANMLRCQWIKNPSFLMIQVKAWVKKDCREEFTALWGTIIGSIVKNQIETVHEA
mmetsp:Transcript_15849/g.18497  ORF Transcript_15849/g.18497 Transcript_15849/m.18497 type:complete len:166 (-) Transcript_15849:122-619(-)